MKHEISEIHSPDNSRHCRSLMQRASRRAFTKQYLFLLLFWQETWYWQGDSSADAIVMSGVRCSGTELTLDQCLHHGKHIHCPRGGGRFAAGVSCTESKTL